MTNALHVICHHEGISFRGLHPIDAKRGLYLSECWIVNGDPAQLKGGYLYFHESSSKRAEFAAQILDVKPHPHSSGTTGIAFEIQRIRGAGQLWRGSKPTQKLPHGGIVAVDRLDVPMQVAA